MRQTSFPKSVRLALGVFFVLACLGAAILPGCAGFTGVSDEKAVRTVSENRFTSNFPGISIAVAPQFIYLGSVDSRDFIQDRPEDAPPPSRYLVSHIFVEPDNQRVKKAVTIQVLKSDKPIDPYFFGDVKTTLDTGTCEVGGEKYKYYTQLTYPPPRNPLTRLILDKGYKLNCGLSITAGRIAGPKGDYLFKLIYIEDLIYSGFSCSSYQRREAISKEQLEFLNELTTRFNSVFFK
ncbi:MAG: hypothetical protein KKA60_03520 [Proteobacteria bacterium]|nr:hypothetical protein [Pseudomonadota bacterium]